MENKQDTGLPEALVLKEESKDTYRLVFVTGEIGWGIPGTFAGYAHAFRVGEKIAGAMGIRFIADEKMVEFNEQQGISVCECCNEPSHLCECLGPSAEVKS
jgi:hypothetical protein